MTAALDEQDLLILCAAAAVFNMEPGPRIGDFVEFAGGVTRRISHIWFDGGVQTSDGGSWHLGLEGMSFSGSLHRAVPKDTLTDTGEMRDGEIWFFHHGEMRAHNGVHAQIPLRVFRCALTASGAEPDCICGIPSKADFYVDLTIGRGIAGDTETMTLDGYFCAEHVDDWYPERLLPPELAAQGWEVLASAIHEINKEEGNA